MQTTANKTIRIKIKRIRQFRQVIDQKVNRMIKSMETCYSHRYQDDWEYIQTALKALSKECEKMKEQANELRQRLIDSMEKNDKALKRWRDKSE